MEKWGKKLAPCFALFLLLLIVGVKSNAMMVKIPLEQLTRGADLILLGWVESIEGKEAEKGIFSLATISPEKVVKGKLTTPAVLVKFRGGAVEGRQLYIEDTPDYRVGERVMVFLKKVVGKDYYQTVGLFQGKYSVKEDIIVRKKISLKEFIQKVEDILRH